MKTTELSVKQERFLLALMNTETIIGASKKAGISNQTAHAYLNDDVFDKEYKRVRRETFEVATNKIKQSVNKAVDVLRTVQSDEEEHGSIRVQAARTILSNASKAEDLGEMEERIKKLEEYQQALV